MAGIYFILKTEPIPQPLSYHDFADTRVFLGIPHAGDVLTNLSFIIVGIWGHLSLSRMSTTTKTFLDDREKSLFQWLFFGVFLTGLGSGWYHLAPDNHSLVWDRIPMTIGFMSLVAIMIAERVKLSIGIALLWPLITIGIATVIWWIGTEYTGHGDLRPYLIVQFYPMITIALMLLSLTTPYTHSKYYVGLFLFYAVAKIAEILDHELFNLTQGVISGHSLKHLFAAGGVACVLRMLWVRQFHPPQKTSNES